MKEQPKILKEHILTGTSHMIPFITTDGILFSLAVMLSPAGATVPETGWPVGLTQIGLSGLMLSVPVLDGYIAYSITDKPGLTPGMTGAYLTKEMGAGFLGGMVAGLIAGVMVEELKRIKLPISLKTLDPIFIYPLMGTLVTGGIIVWGTGGPIAAIMNGLTNWLSSLGDVDKVPLASILEAIIAFGVDGPVNKIATLLAQTQVDMLPYLMGGVGVVICAPPTGTGIATLLAPKKYNVEKREAGKAAILMGCVGITEGAIPFTANDPLRVVPSLIVGAVVGSIVSFLVGVLSHAPWGGLIVLPVVENRIWYFIAMLAGGFVTALMANLLKKNYVEEFVGSSTDLDDLGEITFDEL